MRPVHVERAPRGSIAWLTKKRCMNWLTCLRTLNSNVHFAEYATMWSVAPHHGSLSRPIPLRVVPTCNRFTFHDIARQCRLLVAAFGEVLKSARPRDAMALTTTKGDDRRSGALDQSLYRELARAHAPMEMPMPFDSFLVDDPGMAANFESRS